MQATSEAFPSLSKSPAATRTLGHRAVAEPSGRLKAIGELLVPSFSLRPSRNSR